MICTYELEITSKRCPTDQKPDRYDVLITSSRVIYTEQIADVIKRAPEITTQEDLTAYLARELAAKVTTVGHHYGVKVTCSA